MEIKCLKCRSTLSYPRGKKECHCLNVIIRGGQLLVQDLEAYEIVTPAKRANEKLTVREVLRDFEVDHETEGDPGKYVGRCICGADVFATEEDKPTVFHEEPICENFDRFDALQFLAFLKAEGVSSADSESTTASRPQEVKEAVESTPIAGCTAETGDGSPSHGHQAEETELSQPVHMPRKAHHRERSDGVRSGRVDGQEHPGAHGPPGGRRRAARSRWSEVHRSSRGRKAHRRR